MAETGRVETGEMERRARELGERSASMLQRLGFGRLAGGVLLILVGVLVISLPALIVWIVGVGAIVLGVLVLLQEPPRSEPGGPTRP